MHKFFLGTLLCGCLMFVKGYGQSVYTRITQQGNVVFSSGVDTSLVPVKERMAQLCNRHICKHYPKKKLPLIYLSIVRDSTVKDVGYQLSYDNLYGNSLDDNASKKGKYYRPGLKIEASGTNFEEESLLKILEYGINNLSELKSIRNQAIKDDAGTNKALKLSPDKINEILLLPLSYKIKNTLEDE